MFVHIHDHEIPGISAALHFHQYTRLQHVYVCGLYGFEDFDGVYQELENAGLIVGKWFGSLEYPPRPCWHLTSAGEKVLKLYKEKHLHAPEKTISP